MDAEKVEKVDTGLELCTSITPDGCLMLCPYKNEQDQTYSGFCEQVLKRDALSVIRELQAENERLRHEKDDAVKRITEEIDLNPAYEPDCGYTSEIITFNYQLGYQEGLQKALNIINDP